MGPCTESPFAKASGDFYVYFLKLDKRKRPKWWVSRRVAVRIAVTIAFRLDNFFSTSYAEFGVLREHGSALRAVKLVEHAFVRRTSAYVTELVVGGEALLALVAPSPFLREVGDLFRLHSAVCAEEVVAAKLCPTAWAILPTVFLGSDRLMGSVGRAWVVRGVVFPHHSILRLVVCLEKGRHSGSRTCCHFQMFSCRSAGSDGLWEPRVQGRDTPNLLP